MRRITLLLAWLCVVGSGIGASAERGLISARPSNQSETLPRYLITIDPFIQQAKLTASDGAEEDNFGISVALSSDGNTAIAGADWADVDGAMDQGAAYVFTRSGGSCTQQVKLTALDGAAGDLFGYTVALSSDGNTAIAGADCATVGGNDSQGAAYVFTRSGAAWSEQARLIASDGAASDRFGVAVALSSDGNTAIAGAYRANVDGVMDQGAAYVFAVCTLQFETSAYSVSENSGCVTMTVTRANGTSGVASVLFQTTNGTASAGTDYTATNGTLTWADGNLDNKTITARIINRSGTQGNRSFSVVLSGASGASLGSPASATVTITDIGPGPTIRANDATNNVTVNYPDPLSITVEMNADIYAGAEVDWWVVAFAHSGAWYYLDSAMQWPPFSGDLAFCQPVYQGALVDLSSTPVLSGVTLLRGTYDFWFVVDYPMDGILDPNGQILYDKVTVVVQ